MFLTNLMHDDLEIDFITSENLTVSMIAFPLLFLSFLLNVYLENTLWTYLGVTLPVWISLILFLTTQKKKLIPSQKRMKEKWGNLLMYNGKKFVKNTDLTMEQFKELYIDSYQKDDQLREIEYSKYKQNSEIFAIQINNKDMDSFPNEHFQLKNGKLICIKKNDWIVTDQPLEEIYVIQDKTLRNTYISENNQKILESFDRQQ